MNPAERVRIRIPDALERSFAQRLQGDRQVYPRVVMQVGGRDSFQAIEPYLNGPTEDVGEEAGVA